MNLFQILANVDDLCSDTLIQAVICTVKNILTIIQIAIPVILIVLCTIDMFKAFTSGDEKETKKAWQGVIKRLVFAAIALIIPWLIKLGFSLIGRIIASNETTALNNFETFFACWEEGSNSEETGYCTYPNEEIKKTTKSACVDAGGDWEK